MNQAVRVPVLMYHRVGEAHNDWEARYAISAANFAAHMHTLARKGYRRSASTPWWIGGGRPCLAGRHLVTFDGSVSNPLPVLESLGWPFTVFLVSDLIGGEDVWTRASNPAGTTYPLLDAQEIQDMQRRGVSFHSHTRSHASLPALDEAQLTDQLAGSRSALAPLLGHEVPYIAFGHLDEWRRHQGATGPPSRRNPDSTGAT
jgi:peptidoglycan/xylan/chitin deacetylase (PgdA/CDA1 family)